MHRLKPTLAFSMRVAKQKNLYNQQINFLEGVAKEFATRRMDVLLFVGNPTGDDHRLPSVFVSYKTEA